METLTIGPALSSESANLAYRRIDALLRAYGIQHAAVRGVHAHRVLREALEAAPADNVALETKAAEIVLAEIQASLNKLAPVITGEDKPAEFSRLLLTVKRGGIPRSNPEILLKEADLSAEETERLRTLYQVQPSPQIRRLSMGAPRIRFEQIEDVAVSTSAAISRVPAVRRLAAAVAMLLLVFIVYSLAK